MRFVIAALMLWPVASLAQTPEPDSTLRVGDRVSLIYFGQHINGVVTEIDDSLSVDSWRGRRTVPVSTELRVRKQVAQRPVGAAFLEGAVRGALIGGVIAFAGGLIMESDGFEVRLKPLVGGYAAAGAIVVGLLGVATRGDWIQVPAIPPVSESR